jgi:hypothetical protein
MKWININEKLPEGKQEVLAYHSFADEGQIDILTYFKKDDVMEYDTNTNIAFFEERLLDSLFNEKNEIKASEDGFYIYDNITGESAWRKHADIITHWMALPEYPIGG